MREEAEAQASGLRDGLVLVGEIWAAILTSHRPFPLDHHADTTTQTGSRAFGITRARAQDRYAYISLY